MAKEVVSYGCYPNDEEIKVGIGRKTTLSVFRFLRYEPPRRSDLNPFHRVKSIYGFLLKFKLRVVRIGAHSEE